MRHERLQQMPLRARQPYQRAVATHLAVTEIDREPIAEKGRRRRVARHTRAAELGLHACDQFGESERFGDIVVGTGRKELYLFLFGVAGGQHENGNQRPPAEFATHGLARHVG